MSYETDVVRQHLINDEYYYTMVCHWAEEILDVEEDVSHAIEDLEELLADYFNDLASYNLLHTFQTELLTNALSEVNWYEIAREFIEEA